MNKKLMIAAVAAFLSVTSVYATSISGVDGSGGIFNIDPTHANGDVGFRQYGNFQLSEGDIANLIYKYGDRAIETFVNLVDNKIDINGIVNTMRDGNFYNGHAIFISPNGLTVGASGVLNVGTLSVITPEQGKYNSLKDDLGNNIYDNISQISKLKQDSNAPINIDGQIFARNGVDLRGTDINIAGGIVNGVTDMNQITTNRQAETLFNRLVNTDGINPSANAVENGSLILIRSDNKSGAGITVSGKIANLGETIAHGDDGGVSSGIFLTNKGNNGLKIEDGAVIASNNRVQLYNYKGDLTVNGNVSNKNDTLIVTNRESGADLNIGGKLTTDNELAVSNVGTGKLTVSGTTSSVGRTDIVNEGAGGMEISGTVGDTSVDKVRIINRGGELVFASGANVNAGSVLQVENTGDDGLTVEEDATLTSQGDFGLKNKAGNMTIGGKVGVVDGDMNVWNEGTDGSQLTLALNGQINGHGDLSIKNTGKNGMTLNGTITNEGETAINNYEGKMTLNGVINNTGNMGIINKRNGTGLDILQNADIRNEGDLNIVNNSGAEGMNIVGKVDNTGNMRVYNENGHLTVANNSDLSKHGSLANHEGYMYIFSRKNSTGITAQTDTNISNEMGNLAIKHEGKTTAGERGMNLQGNITNSDGDTAINNYSGDMYVSGNINVTDGNLGIINRQGGGEAMFASAGQINQSGTGATNIKNYGSGDMTVNNEISHEGRLNILGNTNHLYLGGKIHNNGGDYTYAASRENGTGLTASENFKVDGSGNILIKNITGSDGLDFNGTIENEDGTQSALVNHKGDMNISGDITNTGSTEAPIIISNKGDGLNITEDSTLTNDAQVKIVNTGSKAAVNNGKVNAPEGQYSFIEKLKNLLNL